MTDLRGSAKAGYVRAMFARISPRYDLMNRLMTFGLDQGWRARVVREAAVPPGGRALDLATGTGDIALAFGPGVRVTAADFCPPMLRIAASKAAGRPLALVAADALSLPFADGVFDAVSTGFAMRNVADIGAAFAEMHRVTRPGGRVVCLEVARPRNPLVRRGHGLYFRRVVPLLGRLVSGQGAAYAYLPASADRFPPPPELAAIMTGAGWRGVRWALVGLGAAAVHTGVKEPVPEPAA
jgi:demethylmenaquinone methyltransferase/2-methoxy-6-polyprenyl-1,4-benzoquinol methylase